MPTDFTKGVINISGSLKPTTTNTPTDVRTRIESISEVESIPVPFVGMIFYVIDEDKFYKVKSLKPEVVVGIEVADMLVDEYEELIPSTPRLEFNEAGELVVTIDGISKVFVPKQVEPEEPVEDHSGDLRLAQVYGSGGKTDGIVTTCFIELFNMGDYDVPLNGITINYCKMGSTSKNAWQIITLPENDVIPAHHSYLIHGAGANPEGLAIVPEADFSCGALLDNGGTKVVLSKSSTAYPMGQIDPFEIDDTIIDHIYACAEDKIDRFDGDVIPIVTDISKNKAVYQKADGLFDVADYKDSEGNLKDADLLPHNLSYGPHRLIKLVGPDVAEVSLEIRDVALQTDEDQYIEVTLINLVDDFVVSEIEINDIEEDNLFTVGEEEMQIAKIKDGKLMILAPMLLEKLGQTFEFKVKSDKYYRIKLDITVVETPVTPEA